jgi:hypothetical protein
LNEADESLPQPAPGKPATHRLWKELDPRRRARRKTRPRLSRKPLDANERE